MATKIIIIVGVSVVSVLAMFAMGWYLDRSKGDGDQPEDASQDGATSNGDGQPRR